MEVSFMRDRRRLITPKAATHLKNGIVAGKQIFISGKNKLMPHNKY